MQVLTKTNVRGDLGKGPVCTEMLPLLEIGTVHQQSSDPSVRWGTLAVVDYLHLDSVGPFYYVECVVFI